MILHWLDRLRAAGRRAKAPPALPVFSLARLALENPGLAAHFQWRANSALALPAPLWLHLGCGERVLDGFVNLDFIPHDDRVIAWNLLDLWPDAMADTAAGVFSEDVLEHFFHAEQVYILCNVNRVLQPGAVARTLMPSLTRLVDYSADYKPMPDEFLHSSFGVETGADALNIGLRFSGHRWLHSAQSLGRMAESCGFAVEPTSCAMSPVGKFNGLNLRDESNSLSFASDLRKVRPISRTLLMPQSIRGAQAVEALADGVHLYVATAARPTVGYAAPQPVDSRALACINIRSSNLSSFAEHNLKTLAVDAVHRDQPWYFDETLKSRPCMNLVTRSQARLVLGEAPGFSQLWFSPAARAGEYFTLGCMEIYLLDQGR
jgi:predicted SAM-dependent methyltransferase